MKVILAEDVDKLGSMGETVNVAPGYARNFLFPRKLAVESESATGKQIDHELRIIKNREQKRRSAFSEVRDSLDGTKIEITARSGEEGKLYGSVTSSHIAEHLKEMGHIVDRRKIDMPEPLKSLGDHEIKVKLATGIEATILIQITSEGGYEATTEEPPEIDHDSDDDFDDRDDDDD